VRGKLTDKSTGNIKFYHEMIAGGSAGACQVVSDSRVSSRGSSNKCLHER
jgi:hypothetical protein